MRTDAEHELLQAIFNEMQELKRRMEKQPRKAYWSPRVCSHAKY